MKGQSRWPSHTDTWGEYTANRCTWTMWVLYGVPSHACVIYIPLLSLELGWWWLNPISGNSMKVSFAVDCSRSFIVCVHTVENPRIKTTSLFGPIYHLLFYLGVQRQRLLLGNLARDILRVSISTKMLPGYHQQSSTFICRQTFPCPCFCPTITLCPIER